VLGAALDDLGMWAWLTSVTLAVADRQSAYSFAKCRRLVSPTFFLGRRHFFE